MKKITASLVGLQLLLAQTGLYAEAAPLNDQGLWQTITMIGIALIFFYFILWRPEQKRRRALEEQRAGLKKGDRVSAMGIVGTVSKIQDETVILRMVDGGKIEMLKGAVTDVIAAAGELPKGADAADND